MHRTCARDFAQAGAKRQSMARCILAGVVATYVLAVFQSTLGGRLAVGGVSPDLLFVWSVCIGLLSGAEAGAAVGFGSGFLEGGLQQAWTGALAISKGASGFASGLVATKVFRDNWLVPPVSAAVLTLLNEAIFLALARGVEWRQAGEIVGVRMVYHALLAPIFFAVASRARRSLLGQQAEVG